MTDDSVNHTVDRRAFVKTASGAATIGLLAGCSESGGDAKQQASGSTEASSGQDDSETTQEGSSNFPQQPVKMLIPYSTGGGYNYYTRLTAKYINENDYLPVEVQAQNKTGGGGVVGHNAIYNADPNGYTNGIVNPDSMAKAQIVQDEVRFDLSELTFYPRIAGRTAAIGVGTHTDIKTGSEFIEAISNGDLTVGTSGITDSGTMIPIALGRAGGAFSEDKVLENHVVFDGKGGWITAMKRGDVDVMAASLSSLLPYVESGDVRTVLVFTTDENPPEEVSDADTLTDVDVEDPEGVVSLAGGKYHRVFAGPPDIPEERASTIRTAIRKAIKNDELQKEAQNNDRPVSFLNSEDAAKGVKKTVQLWKDNRDLLEKLKNYEG